MNLADVLRMLLRRWYIPVAGVVLAVICGVGAWMLVSPQYERTGTQMLLPGPDLLPEEATNPYMYLSGLIMPVDIVALAVMDQGTLDTVLEGYPGADVSVERVSASAPILMVTVTAGSDAAAGELLDTMMARTVATLDWMQDEESIEQARRMSIVTLTVDTESRPIERTRALIAGGGALGVVVLSLIVAGLVDGLARRRPRGARRTAGADEVVSEDVRQRSGVDADVDTDDPGPDEPGRDDASAYGSTERSGAMTTS